MSITDVEVLRAACCIAGFDGIITPGEQAIVQKLADKAGVGSVSLKAMCDRAKSDRNFYKEQFRLLHADPVSTMTIVMGVAIVDGVLKDDELGILKQFAERLGMKSEAFEKLTATARKVIEQKRGGAAGA